MTRRKTLATLIFMFSAAAATGGAIAQGMSKFDQKLLLGSWTLVSISNTSPDGKTVQTYGANEGFIVFDSNGRYVQTLIRGDIPKFASNNRNTGTADENKAVVHGSLALFGTYKMNSDGTVTLHVERSSFPNWNGADQKRILTTLSADELKWQVPAPTIGGSSVVAWKRVK